MQPLLQLASAKLRQVGTPYVSVGSTACVKLAGLMRLATPEMLARLRTYFPGTFNPRRRRSPLSPSRPTRPRWMR
jgi:hypothetical protein